MEKVRAELARHAEFTEISRKIAEANEQICEARPVSGTPAPSALNFVRCTDALTLCDASRRPDAVQTLSRRTL